jgi:hypothetical protein
MRSVKNVREDERKTKKALETYERYPSRESLLRILNTDPDVSHNPKLETQ